MDGVDGQQSPHDRAAQGGRWPEVLGVLLLAGLSLWLSIHRVYQVDEAQTVFMARLLGTGQAKAFFVADQLHLYPLALLLRLAPDSASAFLMARLAFWVLAWGNLLLLVWAAGLSLRRRAGWWALLFALALPPWWTYALEARHDNVLLSGLLLMWVSARRGWVDRRRVFLVLGLLSVLMQASLVKSLAYWPLISVGLLLMEQGSWRSRLPLAAAWGLGSALACACVLLLAMAVPSAPGSGAFGSGLAMVQKTERFSPFLTLKMLLAFSPLVAAAMVVLGLAGYLRIRRIGLRAAWEEDQGVPETLFFLVSAVAFAANPTPFPYNLLVPSVLVSLAWMKVLQGKVGTTLRRATVRLRIKPHLVAAGIVLLVLPGLIRVGALLYRDNDRQHALMHHAEHLTAPSDPVFDNTGLVASRPPPGFMWFVNMTNLGDLKAQFDSLKNNPPAVVIPNYRLDYLDPESRAWLREHYVGLARDLWVLGHPVRTPGDMQAPFEVLREGVYGVVPLASSQEPWVELDGRRLPPGLYVLARGRYAFQTHASALGTLVWAGPNLKSPPAVTSAGTDSVFPIPAGF